MNPAVTSNAANSVTPAKVHDAFEWVSNQPVESLNLVVEEYRHKKTGAAHYHLSSDSPENVFLVALRTVPMDSTGVAHILEHTALCGSQRFPVRDPFFMMIRRSLNTFMNAFTSSDWTAYPFASQNKKDFNNLLDVYLDAVFFSRLHALDFAQEGHRIEFEKPNDPTSDLVFKGVVFNEMKGAMSPPVSILWQTLTKYLFPTSTYHYNSGGDPETIPDLSYEELKHFYKTHYHPSNAIFMTYGNIPAFEHQSNFEEKALSRFEKLDTLISVDDEKRYHAPVRVQEFYPLDEAEPSENKTHIVMGWLLGRGTDLRQQLEAHLLDGVLLDDSASPLRYALETSDLGSAPSPLCGLESSNREMSFMCGIEGSSAEKMPALEQLVLSVLEKIRDEGVPLERLQAVLHQLEIGQREISGDSYPYGLQLILEALPAATHRGDPAQLLYLDGVLEDLRQDIQNPEFIKQLVQKQLVDNRHRVTLTLVPDTGLAQHRDQAEKTLLEKIKQEMTESQKQDVVDLADQLAKRQEQEDDPGILPKVTLEDVPAEMHIATGEKAEIGSFQASTYEQGTNGLAYQQIIVDLPELSDDHLDVLPYYTRCLSQLGAGDCDYLEMQALQSSVTGGLSVSSSIRGEINDVQTLHGHVIFSGKSLTRQHKAMTSLLQDTMLSPRFDETSRIRELIAQTRARSEQSVTGSGHSLAMVAAASGLSAGAALSHRLRGLKAIHALKELDDTFNDEVAVHAFAEKFSRIHEQVVNAPRQFLLIGEKENIPRYREDMEAMWSGKGIKPSVHTGFHVAPVTRAVNECWVTNTQVNFCAKAYSTVPVEHPDAAPLTVLGGFLRNGFLHRVIREQGGAYGGGASHDSDTASFRFFSYRDPRLVETLDDFDQAIQWLLNEKHEWRPVEEAILGVVSSIDKPGSPSGEARDAFFSELSGRNPEQRQAFRQRILDVKLLDLQRVGEQYLVPDKASVAVITSAGGSEVCAENGMDIIHL
ncbi:MAG: insulinase family protein [Gammaproteobacteria bacterium]